ncbi:hypothetical protein PVAP13_J450661 [Panicum virgatum]|nr:hypothetical protein PVAP13_J450661 [Panicum virgatum]
MPPSAAAARHPRVLLPFTSDTLRIPDELAAEVGSDEALVVGPTGGKAKPWRVEVGWDGDGAFLGRGWPGFAAACGVAPRWLLVLRHRGHGVLSVKGFDADSCLLREHGARPPPPSAAVEATTGSQDTARKLQFLRVLPKDFREKMLIPAKIVQYIPKEHLDYRKAIVSGPLGKVSPIELEMNQSGVFFRGGWSQFLVLHGITEDNSLLLRYEGNMMFTVKVFEADGHQRESKHKDIGTQQVSTLPDIRERQEESSVSIQKRCNSNWLNNGGQKMQKGPITRLKKAPLWRKSVFKIGPPSWIKKEINANSLKRELALSAAFCGAIGLPEHCTITLKTSMSSTESWQVLALPSKKGSYQLRNGWMRFCKENSLKIGDICTFNVIETTMWHVVVTRCKEKMNQLCYEYPSISSRMHMSKSKWPRSRRNKRSNGSRSFLNKTAFHRKSFYEIGPPSWIKKVINAHTLEKYLALATSFCDAIGLRESCMITLKTTMDSTISWQVRGISIKNCRSYLLIKGWRRFCQENSLKKGDICTFNVIETTVWHVIITRYKEKIDQPCYEKPSASSMKRKREDDRRSICGQLKIVL